GRPGFEENLTQRVLLWKREPIAVLLIVPFHFRVRHHHAAADLAIDDFEQGQLIPHALHAGGILLIELLALLDQLLEREFDLLISDVHIASLRLLNLQSAFDHSGQCHGFGHLEAAGQVVTSVMLLDPLALGGELTLDLGPHDQVGVDDRDDSVFDFCCERGTNEAGSGQGQQHGDGDRGGHGCAERDDHGLSARRLANRATYPVIVQDVARDAEAAACYRLVGPSATGCEQSASWTTALALISAITLSKYCFRLR